METAGTASVPPPNDEFYLSYQAFSLRTIGSDGAWEVSYGGSDVTVGVISSGIDYEHPDLAAKLWRNPGEIPDNGIDDDRNGYVDDVSGWDFSEDDADPMDFEAGRGTRLAGIIAAQTNNRLGVAGTSWYARLMPLKVLRELPDGVRGHDEDVIEALCYGLNNGAQVILIAPILQDPLRAAATAGRMKQAIEYAHRQGTTVVAPAGDCGGRPWDDGRKWCPDPSIHGTDGENPVIYPANYDHVIGVQSVQPYFQQRPEVSHGAWVDISAPGEQFMVTAPGADYRYVRDRASSDYAAAHVAGVAAVMRTVNPGIMGRQVLKYLCTQARKPPGVEFPYDAGGWSRNDWYGCGVVDFEHTVERMPRAVHGVTPSSIEVLTDGTEALIEHRLENPNLNGGSWGAFEEEDWLRTAAPKQRSGAESEVRLTTDVEALRREAGRIKGITETTELLACPVGSINEADRQYCRPGTPADLIQLCPCQRIEYKLTGVEQVRRVYLPRIHHGRAR